MQNKIGSQKNRLEMGLREIESKIIFKFCTQKSDIEVYLPRALYAVRVHDKYLIKACDNAMSIRIAQPKIIARLQAFNAEHK